MSEFQSVEIYAFRVPLANFAEMSSIRCLALKILKLTILALFVMLTLSVPIHTAVDQLRCKGLSERVKEIYSNLWKGVYTMLSRLQIWIGHE